MQIKCEVCGKKTKANSTQYTFTYGKSNKIPVYKCSNCGTFYVKVFSYGLRVVLENGKFVPDENIFKTVFIDKSL